jgi:signal transduction histidine kinase
MHNQPYLSSRDQAERTIALARVVLAMSSVFALWLDPAEPARIVEITYSLHLAYVAYSLILAGFIWTYGPGERRPFVTHATDIVVFSVFQYLTLGPSSPFFVYFIFSLFCGAIRWGWRGTLSTAAIVVVGYLVMGTSISRTLGPSEFELTRFIIRVLYLGVAAGLLVYLGRYEERLRGDIERLARWPATPGADAQRVTEQVIEYAARIVGALRATAVWEAGEEPSVMVASWSSKGSSLTKHAPPELVPLVPPELEGSTFVCSGTVTQASTVMATGASGAPSEFHGLPVHPGLLPLLSGVGLASAPFRTERVAGRVFFTDLAATTSELVPLTEVVAREIGSSLDRLHVTQQLRDIAASEERIRLARDLHDGVLQSLTGIRLELQAAATSTHGVSLPVRDRLLVIERALAIEQRELRLFISGLKPSDAFRADDATLAARLEALRNRVELEWKVPVTIRIAYDPPGLPEDVQQAVPLMVHEAVVNALKHAQPSRVTVTVDGEAGELRIVVADDGHGFAFRGPYDHAALTQTNAAPRSLLDRVTSLGGRMAIESTDSGSRIEIRLSV